ncbi:polysaccharide biosynthesis protein [Anaerocolumna cellulosilytica]|uniref:Polysaccharide biosynthesis protein n=1 Tax=Anaerocolumna cellulosilytica TaxID=433286 RepID=A0A6S6RBY5_9FIRM|nr:flippase [Anaerocolumna cellulosilytica]MBB5195259.1 O-antigen/teichoic acid export membrane protein [Anaerocolumna cellulosilytica]BCJ96732.1 polysaccharide biosynthesis protein [Anaerocolumna cellulosilytica]
MGTLKKNFIYNISYQFLSLFLPLVTTPYISRVLGADGIGEYSYTYSVVYYFMLVAMLGITQHGNRTIASSGTGMEKRSEVFWNIYTVQLITHGVGVLIYLIYLLMVVKNSSPLPWLQLIFLCSGIFDISWLYFGLENFRFTVLRNVLIKLATVVLIFLYVKDTGDLWIFTLIMAVGTLLSQVYLWLYLRKFVTFVRPDIKGIRCQLKPIITLFIPVLAFSVYKVMDKIMLGNMSTYEQVGFYENATKINNIPIGFINAMGIVMLPRMTNIATTGTKEDGEKYIENSFMLVNIIASAMVFGMIGVSHNFVTLYFGEGFKECGVLLVYLTLSVFFIAWANIIRTQYLIPQGMDMVYVISTIVGAVLNLTINLMLIPRYQAKGAAIGTIVAEFSVMFVQMIWLRKQLPVIRYITNSLPYLLTGVIMMFLVSICGNWLGTGLVQLLVQIGLGGVFCIIFTILIATLRKDLFYKVVIKGISVKLKSNSTP